MPPLTAFAGGAWIAASTPAYWKYQRALGAPAETQRAILLDYVRANAGTDFGRAHRFSTIQSIEDFQARVPLGRYEDLESSMEEIARGRHGVLTRQRVRSIVTSSGSVAAAKRIPYTRRLMQEFRRAIAPWVVDLYRRHPRAALGRAYWSITPAAISSSPTDDSSTGFEEDTAYVGGLAKPLVDRTLAVPSSLRYVRDVETFRYLTLLCLLRSRELSVISIWHPSVLTLLLDALSLHWGSLIDDLKRGSATPPGEIPDATRRQLDARPRPVRARELMSVESHDLTRIWPSLAIVSCWADGHAALYIDDLKRRLPGVEIQPKGLLATEAVVTLPFRGRAPLAVRSHFFEFLRDGRVWLADQLLPGHEYSVVVTTGGGLYRYRLDDRVRVDGFVGRTPSLRFLGKEDQISDLCGEKLNESFVARALADACAKTGVTPAFAFIAPEVGARPPRYTLYLEAEADPPNFFAGAVDDCLAANPHYRYCRALGQLGPLRVVRAASIFPRYAARCRQAGQRLGAIKPLALSTQAGWSEVFAADREVSERRVTHA